MFIRTFPPRYSQPDAEAIENLSMAIVVDQKRLGGGSHSTMGTVTDIYPILRRLYSSMGKPHVGHTNVFSFNDPKGMCPNCNGLARKVGVDIDMFLDKSKSLNEGAILFGEYAVESWGWSILTQSKLFDANKKLSKYSDKELELLLYGKPYKVKIKVAGKDLNLSAEGIINRFTSKYITRDVKTMSERTQKAVTPYITLGPCTLCNKLNGKSINDVLEMTVAQALEYFDIKAVVRKLQAMNDVGLNYLTLGQPLSTLSGGDCQRIKLASELHKQGSIYVLDEPTTGLHMSDISHLLAIINRLVDAGNTVIIIERNVSLIKNADWIIDMGPEGGSKGGQVMFEGTPKQLLTAKRSLTSEYLKN